MNKELKESVTLGVIFAAVNGIYNYAVNGKSCSFSSLCGRNIRLWINQKVVALCRYNGDQKQAASDYQKAKKIITAIQRPCS